MGHEPNYITALPFRGAQKVTLFRGTRMSPATACPEWSTHVLNWAWVFSLPATVPPLNGYESKGGATYL